MPGMKLVTTKFVRGEQQWSQPILTWVSNDYKIICTQLLSIKSILFADAKNLLVKISSDLPLQHGPKNTVTNKTVTNSISIFKVEHELHFVLLIESPYLAHSALT